MIGSSCDLTGRLGVALASISARVGEALGAGRGENEGDEELAAAEPDAAEPPVDRRGATGRGTVSGVERGGAAAAIGAPGATSEEEETGRIGVLITAEAEAGVAGVADAAGVGLGAGAGVAGGFGLADPPMLGMSGIGASATGAADEEDELIAAAGTHDCACSKYSCLALGTTVSRVCRSIRPLDTQFGLAQSERPHPTVS